MRRFLSLLMLLALPLSAAAQTQNVSVRDIVDLSKAGLGEEALIALIEVNRPVFPVDVETLKALREAGVAPAVIVAMIRSGRMPPPLPDTSSVPLEVASGIVMDPQPPMPTVVIEHHERVIEVPVPVYVAVPTRRLDRGDHASRPPSARPRPKAAEPVFWGWGGKLRPDAWKPTVADIQKDAKVPPPQRK